MFINVTPFSSAQPTFGGLFMAFDHHKWNKVIYTGVPEFNALTFFDVSEERFKIPHVVTEVCLVLLIFSLTFTRRSKLFPSIFQVARGITRARISLTGWFTYPEDKDMLQFGPGIDAGSQRI